MSKDPSGTNNRTHYTCEQNELAIRMTPAARDIPLSMNHFNMPPSASLEDLIARIALKDRAAFRQLYELTSAKLFGICLRILMSRGDAEDALQETYVKVWHNAAKFAQGQAKPISWLAAIARNQAIDKLRKRKPYSETLEAADDVIDEAPLPEACVAAHQEAQRLGFCIGELDPSHAQAIRQTYLNGWSYKDAAEELNVPLNTVKTWVRRSLLKLRTCLNQ